MHSAGLTDRSNLGFTVSPKDTLTLEQEALNLHLQGYILILLMWGLHSYIFG